MNLVSDPSDSRDSGDDSVVAAQMSELFDRCRAQDFVAIGSALGERRYTRERLLDLLRARDVGCDSFFFAGVLAELPHLPDEDFAALGLNDLEIAILRARFADWYRAILDSGLPS
ncbi:MAG: hypothetical protein JWN52_4945 [Actinomycetia bacterium]|nr:hypothetical protein [Actinomycetes bacterium]